MTVKAGFCLPTRDLRPDNCASDCYAESNNVLALRGVRQFLLGLSSPDSGESNLAWLRPPHHHPPLVRDVLERHDLLSYSTRRRLTLIMLIREKVVDSDRSKSS